MRDYGKIQTHFWSSSELRAVSVEAKLLAAYLLSSPHTNMIGCFRLPHAYASADLNLTVGRIGELMGELETAGFAQYDAAEMWVIMPRFLKFNRIENPNQAKAAAALVARVPENPRIRATLMQAFQDYAPTVAKALRNGSGNGSGTLPQPFRNQEQEQEQEQEPDAGGGTEALGAVQAVETVQSLETQQRQKPASAPMELPLKGGGQLSIDAATIDRWQDSIRSWT